MSKKIAKEELKGPDVFVSTSDKVFNFVEHHFKTFLTVVGIVLVGAVVYVASGYINAMKEQKAAEALYAPEAELKKAAADLQPDKTPDVKKDKAAKETPSHPADFAKDYAPAVEKIKNAVKGHADTKAALVSALNLSHFLTEQKQFAQALEVLDIPKYHPSNSDLLGGFWLMHRGITLLENNQVDPAIQVYQEVLISPALRPFHPEALLKLGLSYELKGDQAKARNTYEKLVREFPETEASTTGQQYLRLLELNAHKQG